VRSEELRELIRLLEESDVEEVEISESFLGKKIRVSKRAGGGFAMPMAPPPPVAAGASPDLADKKEGETASEEMEITDLVPIKSPMVGTFYAAPAPDAEPYVKLGDTVNKGRVVCIVEAMKLMNEIRSEVDGRLVKILVENGEPVEYGQTLFLLTPA